MSTAATTEEHGTDVLKRPCIEFSVLSMLGAGSSAALEDKAFSIAMTIDREEDSPKVMTKHISALLPPEVVSRIRQYKPDWGPVRDSDHIDLGFTDLACMGDVVRLCQLRGVQFAGDQVDRRGLVMLVHLLKREQGTRIADWDWHLCYVVGRYVKEVMRTTADFEPPEPPQPAPRKPEPWDNPADERPERRRFPRLSKYDPYAESANRCRCMGIRVQNAPKSKGERGLSALGFDIYRRL